LFSEEGDRITSDLASVPAASALPLFGLASVIFLAALAWARFGRRPVSMGAVVMLSPLILGIGIASIISFVSVAYYELPTHHCPFDLFQGTSGYVGYPLLISLVTAVVSAALPGVLHSLVRRSSLDVLVAKSEKKWLSVAMSAYSVFIVFAVWPLVFGNLALELM
jgi:hypothetical protein